MKDILIDTVLIFLVVLTIFVSLYFVAPSDTFIHSDNKRICQKKAFSFNKLKCLGENGIIIITKN